jgi:hypothetical protein
MAMLKMIFAIALSCSSVLFAQNVTNTGKATASGTCAVSHSGNNDTIIIRNCGIGKDQGGKIIQLLNAVLAKKDIAEINAKLDELIVIAAKPVGQILNCVGSNCLQNGTQNNFDNRTYGVPKPLPTVINLRTEQLPQDTKEAMLPGVTARFMVSSNFANPMFAIWCDHPCLPVRLCFSSGPGMCSYSGRNFPFYPTNSQSIWVTQYGEQNMLISGEYEEVTFRSRDDQPVDVIKVEAYSQ